MTIDDFLQRLDLGEDQDTEFKSAKGGLPKSLWESVSAFANTDGGYLVLGVAETNKGFQIEGVKKPEGLLKTFWDGHNNQQKLSIPLCVQADIQILEIEQQNIVILHIPRAQRAQRPVYINGNPMLGAYKRNHEGDYRCTGVEIRQMLRDADSSPQDLSILEHFDLTDLDPETLKAFRQRFSSREPDHPFLALDDQELLRSLGGWNWDRESGQEGLTVAGLLMFGKERSILDALPNFHLDYQEQLSSDPDQRWTYRLTPDGTWVPNLFNFYYRVFGRLVSNLDIPFHLDNDAHRQGETHVHEALREALVNALIHADHQSSRGIIVVKRANMFVFTNSGRLRIPLPRLYEGGVSDPRNPNLQKMFQMLGLGEKAGSGFQKILRAWKEQTWLRPLVTEKLDLEITVVALPMISMIPEHVEHELRELIGGQYGNLSELERLILVLAQRFESVTNVDIQHYCQYHPREIGECLKELTHRGWLKRTGHGKGTRYQLDSKQSADLFTISSEHYGGSSEHYGGSSEHYDGSSEHYDGSSEHYDGSSEHYAELLAITEPVRAKKRISKVLVNEAILALCAGEFLSLRALADLLQRKPDTLRNHYVAPLLKQGLLEVKFPNQPSHPQQGYRTAPSV